jgi:hypothetical protein
MWIFGSRPCRALRPSSSGAPALWGGGPGAGRRPRCPRGVGASPRDLPSHPHLILPFPPGGATDVDPCAGPGRLARAGPADPDRQPPRRGWHAGAGGHGADGGTRRLHHRPGRRHPVSPAAPDEGELRPGGRLQLPDLPDRLHQRPGGAPGRALEDGAGAAGRCAPPARRHQLWQHRQGQWRPHRHGAPGPSGGCAVQLHSLQRHGRGDGGPAGRAPDAHLRPGLGRAGRVGQGAGPGHTGRGASEALAPGAHAARTGPRHRGQFADRPGRPQGLDPKVVKVLHDAFRKAMADPGFARAGAERPGAALHERRGLHPLRGRADRARKVFVQELGLKLD